MKKALSIVLGFRDRDLQRVKLSLDSLNEQTTRDFEVLFVDYGSRTDIARKTLELVERYPFANYLYTDTRGMFWSRSHALNIGVRASNGDYILTSDVDMLYPRGFVQKALEKACDNTAIYFYVCFLPKDFKEGHSRESYWPETFDKAHKGIHCVPRRLFESIRGYDEFYCIWGAEDRDLYYRYDAMAMETVWGGKDAILYHQWHSEANYNTLDFLPGNVWGQIQNYALKNRYIVCRNSQDWGYRVRSDDRKVFNFIDPEVRRFNPKDRMKRITSYPAANDAISRMIETFWDLEPGHAMAIDYADFPKKNRVISRLFQFVNKAAFKMKRLTGIDYSRNGLHEYICQFILENRDAIWDYYVGYASEDGISVLVRR